MHAGHGIAGCPSRSIAQLGGTITHKGGGGGRHEGSDFLQSLMVREQCGLMGAAESPSGSALEGTEFNVSVQGVPKGERSVRLETLSKRTADHQPGFNEPPQPPPPQQRLSQN